MSFITQAPPAGSRTPPGSSSRNIATPPLIAPARRIAPDASELEVRPLRPQDRDRLAAAFAPLLTEAELDRLTQLDHISRDAVIAVERSSGAVVAIARYAACRRRASAAAVAVDVADHWRGRGLGLTLGRLIVWRAMTTGFTGFVATVPDDNRHALSLLRELGFGLEDHVGNARQFSLAL